ncbi:spore germination protein GerPE [Cerasibacillus sp. JNUCC 74]
MYKRLVNVGNIYTNSFSFSSTLSIGDTEYAQLNSNGIAVQKERPIFTEADEETFAYPLFNRQANWPKPKLTVKKTTLNQTGTINITAISVIGVSSSSLIQVGSLSKGRAEARIKHFRKLRQ